MRNVKLFKIGWVSLPEIDMHISTHLLLLYRLLHIYMMIHHKLLHQTPSHLIL